MGRRQSAHKILKPLQIRPRQRGIMAPVLVGAGVKLADPGLHEGRLVEQDRPQAEELLQLVEGQLAVDAKGAELLRMLRLQIVGDEFGQVRDVRPAQAL
jgi:hypothetical protein